jgi:hypothetical protein
MGARMAPEWPVFVVSCVSGVCREEQMGVHPGLARKKCRAVGNLG